MDGRGIYATAGNVGSCGPASNRFRIRGFCRRQVPRRIRNRTTPAPVRQGPRRAANGTPQRIRERVLFHILFPAHPPLPQYPVPPLQEQRRHLQRYGLKNGFPRQGTPFGIVITPRPCPACSRRYPPSPAAAARHAGHHRLQTGGRTGLYIIRQPTAPEREKRTRLAARTMLRLYGAHSRASST